MNRRKYKITGLLLFITLCQASVQAQSINLHLPFYAQKEVALVLQKGVQKDTVSKIRLNAEGKATFPSKDFLKRTGLVMLSFGSGASFSFIASPKEVISLACTEAALSVQNVRLTGATENAMLDQWFTRKVFFQQKLNSLNTLVAMYEPKSTFYSSLVQERALVENQQLSFSDSLKASQTFAAGFIQIRSAFESFFSTGSPSATAQASLRQYLLESLDFELLYGSNMWFDVINGSISVYGKGSAFEAKFGEDMVSLLKKAKTADVFAALAEASISICEKFALTKEEEAIVNYLVDSDRLPNPQGKLKRLMQLKSTQIGSKAPNLMIVQNEGKVDKKDAKSLLFKTDQLSPSYSLLLFHETGCPNCEVAIKDLKGSYDYLVKKGVRVISLAADTDEVNFKTTSSQLPWKDAYCDYKSFAGVNFLNYAIMATPTMFILNDKGIIQAKLASAQEVIAWFK